MIEVNNLIKKFDDFYALNGVNMNVGEGDIYGLNYGSHGVVVKIRPAWYVIVFEVVFKKVQKE